MSESDNGEFALPLTEAMDLLDRFWNAQTPGADWTMHGADECGNCRACWERNVLGWTFDVLSNPDLADHAERLAKKKPRDRKWFEAIDKGAEQRARAARTAALDVVLFRLQPPDQWPTTSATPDRGYEAGWRDALAVVEALRAEESS